jgi:D-3-phosphoglycerate dehydrogenase
LKLVVITDSDLPSTGVEEGLLADAGLDVRRASCRTSAEVAEAGADADALIVQWAPVDDAALAAMPRLRFISRLGIGYDMIDVAAASARGVAVANTPDYCVEEVVSHALALVLACTRGVVAADRQVRAGAWAVSELAPPVRRPSQVTLGVLGLGRIGSLVAEGARALGFRVIGHDPAHPARSVPFDELLAGSDVLTLHLPLTPGTRHLIDAAALARLRPGAIVVNTGRGPVVDEAALADALHSGRLGGAALDVYEREPLPLDSPLRALPGVILSPHAAWYSPQALTDLPRLATQQVIEFLAGNAVPNLVNAAALAAQAPTEPGGSAPEPTPSGGNQWTSCSNTR